MMSATESQIIAATENLPGYVPWPEEFAELYRACGYWQGQTLGDILRASAKQYPAQLAVVCGARRWTYAELDQRADQLAAGFLQLGLGPRQRVVLQLPNIAEFYAICFALFRIGAIPVFALPAHRRAEISYFCQHTAASAYIFCAEYAGFDYTQLARELKELPSLAAGTAQASPTLQLIALGLADADADADVVRFESLYKPAALAAGVQNAETDTNTCAAHTAPREPKASEVAFMQLSGGSTGLPKLIARSHDDYLYSVRESARICGLTSHSVYLCALPAAHNFPFSSPGSLGIFYAGGTVVLCQDPSPSNAFALIQQEQVNITALVPSLLQLWLEAAAKRGQQLPSLKLLQVGGAPLAQALALRVSQVLACQLQQVFGMAEGLVNYTRLDDAASLCATSQGRPISAHDEILILDDHDQPLAMGQVGHLLTRGPYTIRGYYQAEEHNARAFTADGFYRTGDLVQQLPSGHLVVHGRAKDQINRGGEKLAAEEVESHLLAHPQVHAAALVAMPDPYLGERSCAFIICRPLQAGQNNLRARELAQFLQQRGLAQYKIPDRIEFVSKLPMTAVGKVNKRELRAQFVAS